MGKIEDFTMCKLNRGDILSVDQAIESLGMVAILNALEDITQEINAVTCCLNDKELFPTAADVKNRANQAAALIGNDRLYNLREVLRMQTMNLKEFARLVDFIVVEPNADKRRELAEQREKLPGEYYERGWRPAVSHYMEVAANIAKQQAERLRNYTDASQDGGDE